MSYFLLKNQLKKAYSCNCDYCSSSSSSNSNSNLNTILSHSNTRKRSKSCTYLDNFRHTQCKSVSNGSYYYNLWQSELFRVRAFERQNEKLEQRVKCLENKLEKETQQQIKISLEWRKTVINLVDENTRIKLLLAALSKEPNS